MNVLYYLRTFPKLSESFILNEIYELVHNGHEVVVCSLNEPTDPVIHEEYEKLDLVVQYIEPPTYSNVGELFTPAVLHPRVLKQTLHVAPAKHHAANIFRAKRCIEFVRDLERDIDHIHTHFADITRVGAAYVAAYFDIPFTVTTHAFDLYREPVGQYTTHLLRNADRIVTISEYNKRYIRERFTDETPIDIVRAGIRPASFIPSGSVVDNRILTVSRLVEKKGLKYALEAVAQVAEQIDDVEYHVVGSGEREAELKRTTTELGIEGNVTFLANVSDQRLHDEFDQARCFLLPSLIDESGDRDGIPVAMMEAMAMKTPPVSTRVSGIPELVDHEGNGLLVDPRDSEAIAEAVIQLLQNDVEWSRYRDNARRKVVREFNITNEVEKLEATFEAAQSS